MIFCENTTGRLYLMAGSFLEEDLFLDNFRLINEIGFVWDIDLAGPPQEYPRIDFNEYINNFTFIGFV